MPSFEGANPRIDGCFDIFSACKFGDCLKNGHHCAANHPEIPTFVGMTGWL
jgi:hypothetical protein